MKHADDLSKTLSLEIPLKPANDAN